MAHSWLTQGCRLWPLPVISAGPDLLGPPNAEETLYESLVWLLRDLSFSTFVCWEHSLLGSNCHEKKPKVAAQREREGVGCSGLLATPAKHHVSEGPRLRSAQVMLQAAEPALIPGPQTHEQIK